jgi:hypothetical protein
MTRLGLLSVALVFLWAPPTSYARKPADVFKGRVIVSTKRFPTAFKSDRAFTRYLKKVHRKWVEYGDQKSLDLEFMAFFKKRYGSTEFTGMIFDVTGPRTLVETFSIYPQQRTTRVLASNIKLTKETFPEERRYYFVVTLGQTILAETNFAIKESAHSRAKRKAAEREAKKTRTYDFGER